MGDLFARLQVDAQLHKAKRALVQVPYLFEARVALQGLDEGLACHTSPLTDPHAGRRLPSMVCSACVVFKPLTRMVTGQRVDSREQQVARFIVGCRRGEICRVFRFPKTLTIYMCHRCT